MSRRRRRFRPPRRLKNRRLKNRRLRRALEALEMLGFVLVAIPLIIVAAPFVLAHYAWTERRRACPLCGERGTLEPLPIDHGGAEDGDWLKLRRINPERTVLRCRACGLHIRRVDLEAPGQGGPPLWSGPL
ncbi:hypothetical protein [Deinococcus sp.]|uniref:hypothetical protein n=1 Tax=Deinococcus sp. TaxID=47478 RepID=UPI003CC603DE